MSINKRIELTNIKPSATTKDIKALCNEAINNGVTAICVNPEWVWQAKKYLKERKQNIKVVQVYGFPTSKSTLLDGDEIDVLIRFKGFLASKKTKRAADITLQQVLCHLDLNNVPKEKVKVVIETHLLNDEEIIEVTKMLCKHKVAYVKSSTGVYNRLIKRDNFDDLRLIKKGMKVFFGLIPRKYLGLYQPKIKISGGVRTEKEGVELIKLGSTVIGTSKVLKCQNKNTENTEHSNNY